MDLIVEDIEKWFAISPYSDVIMFAASQTFLEIILAATKTMTTSITPDQLETLLARGCSLVDVREPVEFSECKIPGARSIPLGQIEKRHSEIDATLPIVVMCQGGKRGAMAMEKLHSLGLSEVKNLEGGILAWKAAGLPVESGARKCLPLMQQVQVIIGVGVLTGVVLSKFVHADFIYLSAFFGAGLVFAGLSGWCGLAILMSKMPWNHVGDSSCCSPPRSASCSN